MRYGTPYSVLLTLGLLLWCGLSAQSAVRDIRAAAAVGDVTGVVQLLKVDARLLNAPNADGRTALIFASALGKQDVVAALLTRGADVTVADKDGYTALHYAAAWGYQDIVTLLLAKAADPNARDKDGRTPLHWAAATGQDAILMQLMASKGDGKIQDHDGRTPLRMAADEGKKSAAELLLTLEVPPESSNTTKPAKTPVDAAQRAAQQQAVLKLLGNPKTLSLGWSVVDLTPEVVAAGKAATLAKDLQDLTAQGLTSGLNELARRKGKVAGIQYVVVGVDGATLAEVHAKLGAEDGREADELRNPAGLPIKVQWLQYDWLQFGVVGDRVQYVRADCTAASAAGQPPKGGTTAVTQIEPTPISIVVKVNTRDEAEVVYVPAGPFIMGTAKGTGGKGDERPQHTVTLSGYWIYRNEVTVAQYQQFCNATGHRMAFPPKAGLQPTHPVVNVSYDDAVAYAKWAGGRLPTEAEWEKAARGTDGRKYPWGNEWDPERCNHKESGLGKAAPVGSYPKGASPYGANDMLGNAAEWVSDWYDAAYYASAPPKDPQGPATAPPKEKNYNVNPSHPARGGHWSQDGAKCYCAYRYPYTPDNANYLVGFRVVIPEEKDAGGGK